MATPSDPKKREWTLRERGLHFEDAEVVFAGDTFTLEDTRRDYGEQRFVTVGTLRGRMVIVCWTPRDGQRRVFSMRKANEREQKRYAARLRGERDDQE